VLQEVIEVSPILAQSGSHPWHRLGIQAFEPKLVDGSGISCTPWFARLKTPTSTVTRWPVHVPWPSRLKRKPAC